MPRSSADRLAVLAALAALTAPAWAMAAPVAVLQGLDKVTARVSTIEVPMDTAVRFGALEVVARACIKAPPEDPPESAAFLEIRELPSDAPPEEVFSGWMFASSPGLSAMEHPVYDLWVLDCREDAPATDGEADSDAEASP